MTEYTPRNDNVLVLPDEAETMSGRIHIPASSIKIPNRGIVVAVGPGYLLTDGSRSEMDLKEGDRVQFQAQPGSPIVEIGGENHFVLKEQDVLLVITGEPEVEMKLPGPPAKPATAAKPAPQILSPKGIAPPPPPGPPRS